MGYGVPSVRRLGRVCGAGRLVRRTAGVARDEGVEQLWSPQEYPSYGSFQGHDCWDP